MPSGWKQSIVNEDMTVERGSGPPDKDNEIVLETGTGLPKLKKIRPISSNEGAYSLIDWQNISLG